MKRKKIIIVCVVYLLYMLITYLYCLPESRGMVGHVAINSIVPSLMSFGIIMVAKLPNYFQSSILKQQARLVKRITPITFGIFGITVIIIGVLLSYIKKDFTESSLVLFGITVLYNCYWAWQINRENEAKED